MLTRLKVLWHWLKEAPAEFGLSILSFLAAVATGWLFWPSAKALSYAGLELQLFGVITVWWGIQQTRKLFTHPGFLIRTRQWWGQRPWCRQGVVGAGAVLDGSGKFSATASTWVGVAPDATLKQRVVVLEKNLKLFEEEFRREQVNTKQEFGRVSELISKEEITRQREDIEIRNKMKLQETGGLHISAMGAIWIFTGTIMTTVPNEIMCMLGVASGAD